MVYVYIKLELVLQSSSLYDVYSLIVTAESEVFPTCGSDIGNCPTLGTIILV